MKKYYLVTELERREAYFVTLNDAVADAEMTLPKDMNWEIREVDEEVGTEEVVYTHYVEDEE